jgi:two-component system, response regulator YesN
MVSNQETLRQRPDTVSAEKNLYLRILDSFQEAMKLRVCFFPLHGKGEIGSIAGDGHPFCQIIRNCPQGRENCLKDINRAIRVSMKTGEPYIFQCHTDKVEFTAAILDGGKSYSAFVCGPILLRHPNPIMEASILNKVKCLSLDEAHLLQTLQEVPVFSERRVQAAADLLFMIANYFSKADATSQAMQHEITRQQALLADGIVSSKRSKSDNAALALSHSQSKTDLYKEKELIDLIKMGDRKGAKELLDGLLGTTLFRSHEHIGILKARALEIIFIIARAAV